ncbi:hypothetical protein JHK82_023370 [Glycine max]|nr:hypothetical protein JHK85_023906 [Glycine max]KAG5138639.1 hypothetical protein JHK82_023370 [Glycine max]
MCGRARCTLRADDVPRACHRSTSPTRTLHIDRYRPAYNVSPGFDVPVVRRDDASGGEGYVLQCMKWGLIPSFTKKTEKPDHYRMFNARSESIDEKASFRRLLPKSRCLVAVEGFYEWKKDGSKKQPYYIHFKDGRPLVFAALYDSWQNSEGETLYTFTIVTTSSSSALQWLHDRMPVILGSKESTDIWLSSSASSFKSVMKPYEESDLVWYPVTSAMGKASFDGPECIKEGGPIKPKEESGNVMLRDPIPITDQGIHQLCNVHSAGVQLVFSSNITNKYARTLSSHVIVPVFLASSRVWQIQVKAQGNTSISMFFSKKGDESKDTKPEQKASCPEVVKTEHTEDLTESKDTKPEQKTSSHEFVKTEPTEDLRERAKTEEGGNDLKFHGSSHSQNVSMLPIKREYETFSAADSKPALANHDQISPNPAKKKEKAKTANDKQPTLFSYFGKSNH